MKFESKNKSKSKSRWIHYLLYTLNVKTWHKIIKKPKLKNLVTFIKVYHLKRSYQEILISSMDSNLNKINFICNAFDSSYSLTKIYSSSRTY